MKKYILVILLGILLCGGVVYGANLYKSSDISYNKNDVTNVEEALNDLYNKSRISGSLIDIINSTPVESISDQYSVGGESQSLSGSKYYSLISIDRKNNYKIKKIKSVIFKGVLNTRCSWDSVGNRYCSTTTGSTSLKIYDANMKEIQNIITYSGGTENGVYNYEIPWDTISSDAVYIGIVYNMQSQRNGNGHWSSAITSIDVNYDVY